MKKQILQFLFVSATLGLIYFTNISFSSGPPDTAVTGGCTCHGAASANTLVSINFNNGGGLNYTNGQTYPLELTVSSQTNQPGAGFALSFNIGSLTPLTPNTQVSAGVWKHSAPRNTGGSNPSVATWTANWTAPASGNTPLQLKAAGNAVSLSAGSSLDEWNFASDLNIPLPVYFESFDVMPSGNQVVAQWSVLNEKNIAYYEVLKSEDGIHFKPFQTMEAVNMEAKHGYAAYDPIPQEGGDWYYVVVAHDLDGKTFQSVTQSISLTPSLQIPSVIPNIVHRGEMVRVQHAAMPPGPIRVLNIVGQEMMSIPSLQIQSSFSTAHLPAGMYLICGTKEGRTYLIDRLMVR